jgi:hypothetical protein
VRILLDECVHAGVSAAFQGHSVKTVSEAGWRSSKDGPLLAFAEEHFDVFVTIDRRLEKQHRLSEMKMGFVLALVPSNEIASYKPIFRSLFEAAVAVEPGQVIRVVAPGMRDLP